MVCGLLAFVIALFVLPKKAKAQVTAQTFTTYTFHRGADSLQNPVRMLKVDNSGRMWAGLASGVAKWTGSSFYTYLTTDSSWLQTSQNNINDLFIDSVSNIWLATGGGLLCLTGGKFAADSLLTTDMDLDDNDLITVGGKGGTVSGTTSVYFGYRQGGMELFNEGLTAFEDSVIGQIIYDIAIDSADNLWFATDSGVTVYQDGYWFDYDTDDGLPSLEIFCIEVDSAGHIWFGGGGLVLFDGDTTWTDYTDTLSNHVSPDVLSMACSDSLIFVGTTGGLVYNNPYQIYPYSTWTGFTKSSTGDSLPSDLINTILVESDGDVWIGTPEGVTKLVLNRE